MNFKNFIVGKIRTLILIAFDCFCFALIAAIYFLMLSIPELAMQATVGHLIGNSALLLLSIMLFRFGVKTYMSIWRYTRTRTYFNLVLADFLGTILAIIVSYVCGLYEGLTFFAIVAPLNALLTIMSRFAYRLIYKHKYNTPSSEIDQIRVAIVGAGQFGAFLTNELLCNPKSQYKPVFFIDNDPSKIGGRVAGLKVYSEDDDILERIKLAQISEIFIAMGNLDAEKANSLFKFYSQTSCKLKIYDVPVKDFFEDEGERASKSIRNFEIEDLLFRQSLKINNSATGKYYSGKTILITGGGGSIGSELCRQVAKCSPKRLIVLDIYENNAYAIEQELNRKYKGSLDLCVEIASVRDRERLDAIFAYYKPDIVFHAAAHKHVPLMEHSGCEAIKNNCLGTYNTADMAEKHGVQKFILISTDKAVNPTNIMGASKRMCEFIVECRKDSKTAFTAVRFGNVLGSNGSVIPLFKNQIEQGGPITITDKRIIRYFMTIPEASQLVMEAGFMAKRGELFVLDMGKPIKIYDLALNMIKLSGLEPHKDIEIKEIGLRPGEKLYEELLIKTEELDKTSNDMIFIEREAPLSRAEVDEKLAILTEAVNKSHSEVGSPLIKQAIKRVVPTFCDPEEINSVASNSKEMRLAEV